jgi:hypothetical protein
MTAEVGRSGGREVGRSGGRDRRTTGPLVRWSAGPLVRWTARRHSACAGARATGRVRGRTGTERAVFVQSWSRAVPCGRAPSRARGRTGTERAVFVQSWWSRAVACGRVRSCAGRVQAVWRRTARRRSSGGFLFFCFAAAAGGARTRHPGPVAIVSAAAMATTKRSTDSHRCVGHAVGPRSPRAEERATLGPTDGKSDIAKPIGTRGTPVTLSSCPARPAFLKTSPRGRSGLGGGDAGGPLPESTRFRVQLSS